MKEVKPKCQCGGKLKQVQYGYICKKCECYYPPTSDFKALQKQWDAEKVLNIEEKMLVIFK